MRTALIIYIALFVFLAIPLVFVLVQSLRNKKTTRMRRTRNLALSGAALALLCALCPTLYTITINRQPLLVIQRVTEGIAADNVDYLLEKSLISTDCVQGDLPNITDIIQATQSFSVGNKPAENTGYTTYTLRLDAHDDIALLVDVSGTPSQSTVQGIAVISGEDAESLIRRDSFQPFN